MQRRDTLAALFWPESDASRARANLRNTLNYLRNALPRGDEGETPHLIIGREARRYLEQAVAQWRTVESTHGEARALIHLGHVTYALGEPELARERLQATLFLEEQINDRTLRPLALGHLGLVNAGQGRSEAARRYFRSALREARARRLSLYLPYTVGGLGLVAAQEGEWKTAVILLTFFQSHPLTLQGILLGEGERVLAAAKGKLETAVYEAAQARGETMMDDDYQAFL